MEAMLQSGMATVASTLVENLKMERTSLHSAAQELKILRAPGRPVPCVHVLKELQRRGGGVPESRPPQG